TRKGILNIKITAKGSLEDLDHSSGSTSLMNMRGVFLHVLGDALGSHLTEHQHVNTTVLSISKTPNRMPRTVSVAGPCWVLYLDPTLCLILVCILLYTTFPLLKESALILLQTLAGSRIIANAHIKYVFHDEGIYATTVQPEFSPISEGSGDSQCELSCRSQCKPKLCCNPTKKAKPESDISLFSALHTVLSFDSHLKGIVHPQAIQDVDEFIHWN
uniref:Solute carrier family 30 member 1b n=1 Tax=Sinocyclocheilus grahami TaxID=75366 RepID=A0A672KE74_SINGR